MTRPAPIAVWPATVPGAKTSHFWVVDEEGYWMLCDADPWPAGIPLVCDDDNEPHESCPICIELYVMDIVRGDGRFVLADDPVSKSSSKEGE